MIKKLNNFALGNLRKHASKPSYRMIHVPESLEHLHQKQTAWRKAAG
jgi:hypothetical protein